LVSIEDSLYLNKQLRGRAVMGIGALGAGVLSVLGATGAWAAAGGIVAGIVGGAIVGAAIGGLSAAVMGGNVLEGMLFGAIGGAVTGGVSAWAAGGSFAGAGAASTEAAVSAEVAGYTGGTQGIGTAGESLSTGSFLSNIGTSAKETGQSVTASFLKDAIGGYMQGEAEDEAREAAIKAQEVANQQQLDVIAASKRGFDPAGMAGVNLRREEFQEQTRQYKEGREDVLRSEAARGGALAGVLEGEYDPLAGGEAPNQQMIATVEKAPQIEGAKIGALKGIEEEVAV
jgi:hypothetical protein